MNKTLLLILRTLDMINSMKAQNTWQLIDSMSAIGETFEQISKAVD